MQLNVKKELTKKSTFNTVAHTWLKTLKDNIKIQSYQKYYDLINNHLTSGSFCQLPISKVNEEDIIGYLSAKEKCGRIDKKYGLSISTIKTLVYIIKATLKFATSKKICKPLDLSMIKYNKKVDKKIDVFTKTEQRVLENCLKEKMNIRKLGILLCLYTGLRVGEISGLKWKYIDLENKQLKVKHTAQRIKNNNPNINGKTSLIISKPKSLTSDRVIPIPDFLVNLLKLYKLSPEYYFLSKKTTPYDPRLYEYFFDRILKKCEIPHVKFHVLRHTFATRAIESKMDIKTLSEILGHASVDITLNIYVHSSIELKRSSLEELVSFMNTN